MYQTQNDVKYTKVITTVNHYATELTSWENIDYCYLNQSIRDKVICKIDATYALEKYFSKDTISKYRDALMAMANAEDMALDPETFSNVIMELIEEDETFRERIRDIFNSCPEDSSFGWYIINVLADVFKNIEASYRSFFRGRPEVVICVSDGYLYFSISDIDYKPVLPDRVECEVLSYAKNWRGEFEYAE